MTPSSGHTPDADAARRESDELARSLPPEARDLLRDLPAAAAPEPAAPPLRLDPERRAALISAISRQATTADAPTEHGRIIPFWRTFLAVSREYGFAQVAALLLVILLLSGVAIKSTYTAGRYTVAAVKSEPETRRDEVVFATGAASHADKAKSFERPQEGWSADPIPEPAPALADLSATAAENDALMPAAKPAPRSGAKRDISGAAGGEGTGLGIGKGGGRNLVTVFGAARAAKNESAPAAAEEKSVATANASPFAEAPSQDTPVAAQPAAPAATSARQAGIDGLSVRAQVDANSEYVFRSKESSDKDVSARIMQPHAIPPAPATLGQSDLKSTGRVISRNAAAPVTLPTNDENRYAFAAKKRSEPVDTGRMMKDDAGRKNQATPASREVATANNAFSTFSLNVSDAAFRLALAANNTGRAPAASAMRAEEFVNAMRYDDLPTARGEAFAFRSETAAHPFAPNRQILRVSLRAAAEGRAAQTPLNLVVALDASGSMERGDRRAAVEAALRTLADKIGPSDTVSVLGFARTQHLLVDRARGSRAAEELRRVAGEARPPEGGTHLEGALSAAYAQLASQTAPGESARVVLLTDGATNLGEGEPEKLAALVATNRKAGRALDCFGIGLDGYDDAMLERLARNGDGRYAFLNDADAVRADFAEKLAGALRPAARDVKVQMEFNPDRVASWRLIGYDKHRLTKEQFRDNTVDAAEIAAAEAGTAVYVIETKPDGTGDLATARVRYLDPTSGEYRETARVVPHRESPAFDQASAGLRLAAVAALTGEILGEAPEAATYDAAALAKYARRLTAERPADTRAGELRTLAENAARR